MSAWDRAIGSDVLNLPILPEAPPPAAFPVAGGAADPRLPAHHQNPPRRPRRQEPLRRAQFRRAARRHRPVRGPGARVLPHIHILLPPSAADQLSTQQPPWSPGATTSRASLAAQRMPPRSGSAAACTLQARPFPRGRHSNAPAPAPSPRGTRPPASTAAPGGPAALGGRPRSGPCRCNAEPSQTSALARPATKAAIGAITRESGLGSARGRWPETVGVVLLTRPSPPGSYPGEAAAPA